MAEGPIDHVDIRVSDVAVSRRFYDAALAPLGIAPGPIGTDPAGGFALIYGDVFTIHSTTPEPGMDTVTTGAHIAFEAPNREAVAAFHRAALAHGGRNVGDPGPRAAYSDGYYGAFVLDPDGNNIEAVLYER
jgi:catechol 2,3-dioxygenase-like lactoylglutathione lyase family enzyme